MALHRPTPPPPASMLGLVALAVELPFLITCLLVQLLKQCAHCRHEWLSWPILPGAFPHFFSAQAFHLFPMHLGMNEVRIGWGAITLSLIGLIFLASWRSAFWRQWLAGALVISSSLAVLTFLIIAA